MKHGQIANYWSRISKTVFGIFLPQVLRKLWILNSVGTAENGVGRPKTATSVNETRPDRPRLKQDIQNCLKNFPSFDIKKVTDLASLTVWNRRKRRGTAKNGQNREWNTARSSTFEAGFPKLSLKFFYLKYYGSYELLIIGPPKTAWDGQKRQNR